MLAWYSLFYSFSGLFRFTSHPNYSGMNPFPSHPNYWFQLDIENKFYYQVLFFIILLIIKTSTTHRDAWFTWITTHSDEVFQTFCVCKKYVIRDRKAIIHCFQKWFTNLHSGSYSKTYVLEPIPNLMSRT